MRAFVLASLLALPTGAEDESLSLLQTAAAVKVKVAKHTGNSQWGLKVVDKEDCKVAKGLVETKRDARNKAKEAVAAAKLAFANAKTAKGEACPPKKEKPTPAPKTYTPDDFALTKANECPEGSQPVNYKTCHDQAANYKWPGQPAGHTQRWDQEDHDPEFGVGWTFMPPGCVLYTGWPSGSHAAQVRWNPNQNGRNDGHRAKVCEKGSALLQIETEKASAACKAARAEAKRLKALLKAARQALKAARAELKNAKEAKEDACPKKEKPTPAPKTYTPEDFALTKANECPEGSKPVDYKTCHDQAGNYQWPGQPAGHTQRWDQEDHDPEFGVGWTFMPPGCVLYTSWPTGSHAAQVRWNPNLNGRNDGHRAKICEKE